jgi:hypothetical protein
VFAEFNPGTLRSFSEIEPIEYLRLFTGLGYRMTVLLRRSEPGVLDLLEAARLEQVDLMLTLPPGASASGPLSAR